MKALSIYLGIYAECLSSALQHISKSAWTLLLPMAILVAQVLLMPLMRIPFLGGIILAALFSCYLYFVGEVVAGSRVRLAEFRVSIGKYLWSVVNLLFVLWIARLVVSLLARGGNAGALGAVLDLAFFVFVVLAPAAEVIYLRGTYGGLQTLQRAFDFLQQNWIEWCIPNFALGALAYLGSQLLLQLGSVGIVLYAVVGGALFHVLMVFRGRLFEELDGTSHRQRMYRQRLGG